MYKVHTLPLLFLLFFISFLSFAQDSNLEAAKFHLQNNLTKNNLSQEDLKEMSVSSAYLSPTTGWYHVYFNQNYQSIEVYNGILNVTLKDGHLIHVGNNFVPYISSQINMTQISSASSLSPQDALVKASESVGKSVKLNAIQQINTTANSKGDIVKYKFTESSLSDEPIDIKLYWYPYNALKDGKSNPTIALVWNVCFQTKDKQNSWSVQVNANSGEVLKITDDVIKCNFGHRHEGASSVQQCEKQLSDEISKNRPTVAGPNSYNVFNYPLESPSFGSRSIVTSPYTNFVPAGTGPGNTNGWHEDGTNTFTDTRGNNVYAQEDTDNNNTGGVRPNPTNYDFDYPYTLGLGTSTSNQNAAITNLFFWNNLVHDVLWKIGFDEPSGNFQMNNMGRGGSGNDFVYADAQDGSGTNNANFQTPVDGNTPRMQMYLWNYSSTYLADSDFDNAVIAHEYGHGWSIRLTGGPNNSSCLNNAEQGGEGWSDYLGLMLTTNWGALTPSVTSANIPRGIGTYVLGQTTSGGGIRPYLYSYNMAGVNSAVTYAGVGNSTTFSQPHGIGSIWCTMLWDMTWEIILQDNAIVSNIFNTSNMVGNVAALKLVNEGLRLQPCSPSFVQARDAILAADQALFGGRYRCAIGRAFARRGLGKYATTGVSSDDRTVTQDFTAIDGNTLSSPTAITICSGTPLQYTATSNTSGTNFIWSRSTVTGISNSASSGGAVINETLINTTTAPIVVTYNFSFTPNGCGLPGFAQQTLLVTVNPAAVQPTVATYSVCQNSSVPAGQGLKMPINNSSTTIADALVSGGPTYTRYSNSSGSYYYKVYSFTSPITGSVNFATTVGSFDTYLFLYGNSFDPNSPSTNLLTYDDDSGDGTLSSLTYSLTQGNTYYVVVTSFSTLTTGSFTLLSSAGGFRALFNWYTTTTGGTPIYTGETFNPVGVSGSSIPNTISPIVKNYYVAVAGNDLCRVPTTFTVNQAVVEPNLSGIVSRNDTVCAIFNSGTLSLTGHSGSVLGWETSEDNFTTFNTTASTSTNYLYSGLLKTSKIRAILSRGVCRIAKSAAATLNVITPIQELSGNVITDTLLNKSSLYITSTQMISSNSKVDYEAGRKIELNSGFESSYNSTFKADIFMNDCYIPVSLTLQPDSSNSQDTDISSTFVNTTYATNRYCIPYTWSQFGSSEVRRTLMKFDLSAIPTNAVIDSAILYLYYSQQFAQDNPPFTGHFGSNTLEVKRITQDWAAITATWTNQPTTSATNMITVASAVNPTQDYPKINVKNIVADQLANGNYGFMIKNQTETPYKITVLTSSEERNAAKRPKLVVYYRYK